MLRLWVSNNLTALTCCRNPSNVETMAFGKTLLSFLLAFMLGAYVADCFAMTAPDEAMKCCGSMPCAPHNHDQAQDCCKTTPSTHSDFVKPSVGGCFSAPVFVALFPIDIGVRAVESLALVVAGHSHAPPIPQGISVSPLRI